MGIRDNVQGTRRIINCTVIGVTLPEQGLNHTLPAIKGSILVLLIQHSIPFSHISLSPKPQSTYIANMTQLLVKNNYGTPAHILNAYEDPTQKRVIMTLTKSALWYNVVDDDFFKAELQQCDYVKTYPQLIKQLYDDLRNIATAIVCGLNFCADIQAHGRVDPQKLNDVLHDLNMEGPPECLLLYFGPINTLDIVLPKNRAVEWIKGLQNLGIKGINWFNTAASRNHWLDVERGIRFEEFRYLIPRHPTLVNPSNNPAPAPEETKEEEIHYSPVNGSPHGSTSSPPPLTNGADEEDDEISDTPLFILQGNSQPNSIPQFKIVASSSEITYPVTPPPSVSLPLPTPPVTPPVMTAMAGTVKANIAGASPVLKRKKATSNIFRDKYITRDSH